MRLIVWLGAALLVYAILAYAASRMLYHPLRHPEGPWDLAERIGAKDVWLTTGDGVKLHGWFAGPRDPVWVTLHLHGNAGNITYRVSVAEHILAAGSAVLLLDYRGYGRSEGRPTEKGLYADADAAYDHLVRTGSKPQQIVLYGESLGTAVAAELAIRRPCAGVVLEAPFTSLSALASRILPGVGPLLVGGFDTKSRMPKLRVPLLVIHGDADEIVDYSFGKEVFTAAPGPKSFWTIHGAAHNDMHEAGDAEFPTRLQKFYASLAKR